MIRYDSLYELIGRLSGVFAPTGCEKRALCLIEAELRDVCDCSYDAIGNLVCHLPGTRSSDKSGKPLLLSFITGVDEAGFMIKKIDDKGYLRVADTGHCDPACFVGKKMTVGNEETLLDGVGGAKVLHLLSSDERNNAPDFDRLFIDVGAKSKEELDGRIEEGDFAAYSGQCFKLPGGRLVGKALECRAGCALLTALLKNAAKMKEEDRYDLYVVFAVKEKIGYSGAVTALHRISPDRAILLGFEPARIPDEAKGDPKGAIPGNGPVLTLKDGRALYYDNCFFEYARSLPFRWQILDGSVTLSSARGHLSGEGVPMISLRLPCRNPETPCVIVDKSDVESLFGALHVLAGVGIPDDC